MSCGRRGPRGLEDDVSSGTEIEVEQWGKALCRGLEAAAYRLGFTQGRGTTAEGSRLGVPGQELQTERADCEGRG